MDSPAKYPWVTICVPAYNAEKTLGATLDSLLKQDYPAFDILVSDNQSTDRTRQMIEAYADRGVRYCRHPEGRPAWAANHPAYIGGFANWNYALSQGKGEFLCLYHSDDVYEPQIVRKEAALLASAPEVGAVFSMVRRIGEDGRPLQHGITRLPPELQGRQIFDFPEIFNAVLRHENFIAAPSVMLRKTAFQAVGPFNEPEYFTCADLELWFRMAKRFKIAIIDEPLVNYRISGKQFGQQYNSLRTTLDNYFVMMDTFLKEPAVRAGTRRKAVAWYEMDRAADQIVCAIHLLTQREQEKALGLLGEALQWRHFRTAAWHPRRISQFLAGALLVGAAQLGVVNPLARAVYRAREGYFRWRRLPAKG